MTIRTLTVRTVTGSTGGADWLIFRQVEVKLFVVSPVQTEEEDEEEDEREDEGPGPDEAEHDWGEPWLGAVRRGVGVTGPGRQISSSLGRGEQAGVAAGVAAVVRLQATVTLLPLLQHRVATEARAPVVLLQHQHALHHHHPITTLTWSLCTKHCW